MQPGDLSATENLRLIQSRQEVGAVYQSALVLRPELICQFSGFSMVDVSPIHRATAADSSYYLNFRSACAGYPETRCD